MLILIPYNHSDTLHIHLTYQFQPWTHVCIYTNYELMRYLHPLPYATHFPHIFVHTFNKSYYQSFTITSSFIYSYTYICSYPDIYSCTYIYSYTYTSHAFHACITYLYLIMHTSHAYVFHLYIIYTYTHTYIYITYSYYILFMYIIFHIAFHAFLASTCFFSFIHTYIHIIRLMYASHTCVFQFIHSIHVLSHFIMGQYSQVPPIDTHMYHQYSLIIILPVSFKYIPI